MPTPGDCAPPTPFGVSTRPSRFARLVSTLEEIFASLLLRCLHTMVAGSFLNEPRPFLLALLYIARKGNLRQCKLELIFYLGDLIKKLPKGKKGVPFKLCTT